MTLIIPPPSFFKYDLYFDTVFFVVSLILCLFSFKLYRKTKLESILIFSIAFFSIWIGYLLEVIYDLFMHFEYTNGLINLYQVMPYFFLIIGHSVLLYVSLKISKIRTLVLINLISLIMILFSDNKQFTYLILSALCYIFICWYFLENYIDKKGMNSFIIMLSFFCFLFSHIIFLLSLKYEALFPLGYILKFIAYMLIIINLYMVQKSGKTKKPS